MILDKYLTTATNILNNKIESLEIIMVANVLGPRGHDNEKQINCTETEHFSVEEFNEIYQGIVSAGFFIKKIFFSEFEFLQDIISSNNDNSTTIVFNLCRNGTGMNKKTIIPAICDLLGIMYTSSGAGPCALARNKLLFSSILMANNITCPFSSLDANFLLKFMTEEENVIYKPNNESASQGISNNSIVQLKNALSANKSNHLIQQYIHGYECEVPIFCADNKCFAMPPVGISFETGEKTGIISYESSSSYSYGFYNLTEILTEEKCKEIMNDAVKAFQLLGLQHYGRVDFRIDSSTNTHYVMDISTTPYLTKHSSFFYAINKCGGQYTDIYRLIIAAALNQNN